jgi:hypothetical protein
VKVGDIDHVKQSLWYQFLGTLSLGASLCIHYHEVNLYFTYMMKVTRKDKTFSWESGHKVDMRSWPWFLLVGLIQHTHAHCPRIRLGWGGRQQP